MLCLLLSGHLAGSYGQRTMKKYGEIVLQLLIVDMEKWAKDIGTSVTYYWLRMRELYYTCGSGLYKKNSIRLIPVSYTHLTLPTTPYV